jgi:hypothetical protein
VNTDEVTIPRAWLGWTRAERAAWLSSLPDDRFQLLAEATKAEDRRRASL